MSLLDSLNPAQLDAVTYAGRYLLVLAGAGSGKTKTLITRMAYAISQGCAPDKMIAVTFTNKAARELKERLVTLCPSASLAYVGTFHRLSHLFLRRYGQMIGLSNDFQIITPSDQKKIFKEVFIQNNEQETSFKNSTTALKALSMWYYNSHNVSPEWQKIIASYQDYCTRQKLVDFDALIEKSIKLFQQDEFKIRFSSHLAFFMIDEFQDTNPSQFRWMNELMGPETSLTVVGDDDQSIYGFRGADVSIIQQLHLNFDGLHLIRLEQNYRSTPTILEAANHVIAINQQRLGKKLWTNNPQGPNVQIFKNDDEYREVEKICQKIHSWLHQGVRYQDIAVLYRSNSLSRLFEAAFHRYQWPFRLSGGLSFFDREEIRDLMAYLQVLVDPHQNLSLMRIINKPARKIGETTQNKILEHAQQYQVSAYEALLHTISVASKPTAVKLKEFIEMISSLRLMLNELTPADLVLELLKQTQLLTYHQQQEKGEFKEDNIYEFINALSDFEKDYPHLKGVDLFKTFVGECMLGEPQGAQAMENETLTLSTCHAAKGLEWPYVIIAGMENDLFPHIHSVNDGEIEEERRLFYVAMTRAKKELCLSFARSRARFYERVKQAPSLFLKELPQSLIDIV